MMDLKSMWYSSYVFIYCFVFRHVFKLYIPRKSLSLNSVRFKLNFATSSCIDELATVTLSVVRSEGSGKEFEGSDAGYKGSDAGYQGSEYKVLCGPILIKPFLDVTDLSITLTLSHFELLSSLQSTLILTFSNLFVKDYLQLTEEASQDKTSKKHDSYTGSGRNASDFRYTMRCRIIRRAQPPKPVIINHCTLLVTLFPYNGKLSLQSRRGLLPLVFCEEFVYKLLLHVCQYHLVENEHQSLPESLHPLLLSDHQLEYSEDQFNALNVLCWIMSLADCQNDRFDFDYNSLNILKHF